MRSLNALMARTCMAASTFLISSFTWAQVPEANVSSGSKINVEAANVQTSAPIATFYNPPKLYAKNIQVPFGAGKTVNASVKIISKIKAGINSEGDPAANCLFEWTKNIKLYDWNAIKALMKNNIPISQAINGLQVDKLEIIPLVEVKLQSKTVEKDLNPGFIISLVPPEITTVTGLLESGQAVVINGNFFGTKAPPVSAEFTSVKTGKITYKKFKINKAASYTFPDAKGKPGKSVMDVNSGASNLTATFPTFKPDKETFTGNIYLDNKIGIAVYNNTATCVLTMEVSPANSGTTNPAIGTQNVSIGQAQAITATADAGYTFVNWTATANAVLADANSASTTATLSADATVTANFQQGAQQVVLTMAVSPANGGTTNPTAGAHNVNAGQAQAITATADAGYTFVNWTATANAVLADANSASTTATLSADATVIANFQAQAAYTLVSTTFTNNTDLPLKCATVSAGGQNISPNLKWSNAPAGTLSFAITCIDKSPGSDWVHWMVFNVPSSTSEIAENASNSSMPSGSLELNNDYGYKGYGGPEPPAGSGKHSYVFTVYALDQATFTPSSNQLSEADFLTLISGHILGQASITGYYEIP